jgi:hypothetical protein
MTGMMCAITGSSANAVVNFVDQTIYAFALSGTAVAAYQVNSNGSDYQTVNASTTVLTQWVTPAYVGGNYEVYATLTSGTLSSGTVLTWLPTSGNPTWQRVAAGASPNYQFANLTMQVRAVGTTTVLDTWNISLTAEK